MPTCSARTSMLLAASAVTLLSACGGGAGSTGEKNGPELISPVQSISASALRASLAATPDDAKALTALVAAGQGADEFGGWVERHNGTVTFASGQVGETDNERDYVSPGVRIFFEADGREGPSTADGYHFVELNDEAYADGTISEETIVLGDNGRVLVTERGGRLYLPAEGSDVHVGAYSVSSSYGVGTHAVFGRETTRAQLERQNGFANFTGVSEAVVGANWIASGMHPETGEFIREGAYSGSSSGRIDFDSGEFRLNADMVNDHGNVVGVTARGAMRANGAMVGDAVFSGLHQDGLTVSGKFDGALFGPDAEDAGGTFLGAIGDVNETEHDSWAAIAGQMILSQNGPRQVGKR